MANFGRRIFHGLTNRRGNFAAACTRKLELLPLSSTNHHQGLRHYSTNKPPPNTVIMFVPQQEAWVVERMGKFYKILEPV